MKLNKAAPSEMHLFWVISSMLAQATRAGAGDAAVLMTSDQLLKMAATLAQKQLDKEGVLSLDALMVYLDVLQAQGRYADALRLVEGPGGRLVQLPQDKLRLRVRRSRLAVHSHRFVGVLLITKQKNPKQNPTKGVLRRVRPAHRTIGSRYYHWIQLWVSRNPEGLQDRPQRLHVALRAPMHPFFTAWKRCFPGEVH